MLFTAADDDGCGSGGSSSLSPEQIADAEPEALARSFWARFRECEVISEDGDVQDLEAMGYLGYIGYLRCSAGCLAELDRAIAGCDDVSERQAGEAYDELDLCIEACNFECDDGQVIPGEYECDIEPDCRDGSDEACGVTDAELEASYENEQEFDCGGGESVPLSWKCDFEPDCENGADEDGCAEYICGTL